ncbi:Aste57867_9486 [Aphanomyces stellatus]|uniref:Aste57867_9486 protein n=1 Tax=Aphanomyces stellatus TaxID=120398 RepID=A0A485KND1_9STRA|nr:hypothetical protein As57867_009449 [Aphanomyces stellatus]VFT86365.1 Aste57867_9486 [Aphanomyces stellatus]
MLAPSSPSTLSTSSAVGGTMFLKKLFTMMGATPAALGGWCDNGTAFEIRNPKEFARVMLPQYFKHCKFTSFVRQLNFYGFQKFKREVLLVAHETDEKALTFSHPFFQQHKPRLLGKIKRKTNYTELNEATSDTCSSGDDVEHLRNEVSGLKNTLALLGHQVSQLTMMLSEIAKAPKNDLLDALEYLEDPNLLSQTTSEMDFIESIVPLCLPSSGAAAAAIETKWTL